MLGLRLVRRLFLLACLSAAAPALADQITLPVIDVAKLAIAKRDFATARTLLTALLQQDPRSIEARFLLATIDVQEGDYESAIARYRDILAGNPDLVRVRLDLARALFLAGDDESATYHFRQVLAGDLPDAVRQNVYRYLGAIRLRKRYDVNVVLAIAPDTNVNAGSENDEVTLFGLPFKLSEDAQRQSGLGLLMSVGGEYRLPLTANTRLRANANLYRSEYSGSDFDDMIVRSAAGPQAVFADWDASLLGVFTKRWFGNEPYSQGFGPRIEASYAFLERWRLEGTAEYLWLDYNDRPFLNGSFASVNLYPTYYVSTSSHVRAIAGLIREKTEFDGYANKGYRVGLGYHQEFGAGITAYVQPELLRFDYDGENPLFGTKRRDRMIRTQLSLYKRDWTIFGFSPMFTYFLTDNDSNQAIYEYQRHQFQIGLTNQF